MATSSDKSTDTNPKNQPTIPEFEKLQTDSVLFDATNPRLGGTGDLSQEELQDILLEEPHYAKDLVESFVENGFIQYEPLVVRQDGDSYVVIEGNRRLAAVKYILSNPDPYPKEIVDSLKTVPALIFHETPDESHLRDIRTYLGVRHLKGYREWPAESKAMFLDRYITPETDAKTVKSEFGIEASEVRRFLIPHRVRKMAPDVVAEFGLGDDDAFWMLGEALGRKGIKEYIELSVQPKSFNIKGLNPDKFRYLLQFLYGTPQGDGERAGRKIKETRELTQLGKVLANERASAALESGLSLEEAKLYMTTSDEAIDLQIGVLKITFKQIRDLKPSEEQIVRIEGLVGDFLGAVKS